MNKALLKNKDFQKLVFSILLLLATIAFIAFIAYAWLTNNRNVNANNIQIRGESVDATVEIYYYNNTSSSADKWELLDEKYNLNISKLLTRPGKSVDYKVVISNTSNQPMSVDSLGFLEANPDEYEIPITIKGENYYLGTQLFATLKSPTVKNTELYLATLSDGTISTPEIEIYNSSADGNTIVAAGESTEFIFTVTFYNANHAQNEYKHFGEYDEENDSYNGYCARDIYVECNPSN